MIEDFKNKCIELEHFETPQWAVDEILKREILTQTVIDPCVGSGILADAAKRAGYRVTPIDIFDWGYSRIFINNFLELSEELSSIFKEPIAASVLMNPPFSKAVEFVEKSFELGARKVVCFQRFAWWESKKRRDFWAKYPPARIYICGDRADCWRHDIPQDQRGSGTPTAHAWYVFEPTHPAGTLIGHIYKSKA
jgi:predicted RNA methylase